MTIRFKLTTIAIAVILVANSLLSFMTFQYLSHVWMGEVETRVQRNISVARAAYRSRSELIAAFLEGAALDGRPGTALERKDRAELETLSRRLRGFRSTDFAALLDPKGMVIFRPGTQHKGDDLSTDPLVARVLREGRAATGTIILSAERLAAEGGDLADRARFEVVPTPAARFTRETVRSEGMAVAAAVPLVDARGQVAAILYGGNLLNRRYEIVDQIKQQVFSDQAYNGKAVGTVTIFQEDLRISTNVTLDDGTRAIGTRLSTPVCEAVLDRGGTWVGPAFVVNDWYITAYEPIRDPAERIVGALYVGILQAPFLHQRNVIMAVFLGIVGGTTLVSLVLLLMATDLVVRPIGYMVAMAQKVIGGDLSARVGVRPPGEIGTLCRAMDSMAQAVAERAELLQQATQQQIGRSEQLASVGRLAAGVAHEINNPLTGVLAFADLLRQKENMDEQDKEDLDVIVRETKRVREIVRGLLDFARETPSVKTHLNINDVIRETVRLLGKREAFQNIYIVEDLTEDLPPVNADKNQLQQVFLNLSLNACEAMPDGGTLLVTSACRSRKIVVEVSDTGCGIKPEHLGQIFEPFFTTKPVGKGTGLGLSVSYGIIHQHGGTLEVNSQMGKGTTFTITFPLAEAAQAEHPG